MAFNYNYNPLDYKTAQKQVSGQIDPLYNRAIQGVNQQKYQSDVQAGQVSAARGLGHSGLAADQLNKIAIAAQGQIGDLNAQRATQIAQQANDLVWRDKEFSLQDRGQKYNEYNSDRNYDYQAGRDTIADKRYQTEWDYNTGRDKVADQRYADETKYNHGRDTLADKRYTEETKYSHGRDKVDDQWRQKEWSQMSPAEKQRMAQQYAYSKKASGGGGGGGGRRSSRSSKSSGSSHSNSHSTKSNKKKNTSNTAQSNLDTYYSSPAVQAGQRTGSKYLKNPVSPADNPYLSAWDKKKMLGL